MTITWPMQATLRQAQNRSKQLAEAKKLLNVRSDHERITPADQMAPQN